MRLDVLSLCCQGDIHQGLGGVERGEDGDQISLWGDHILYKLNWTRCENPFNVNNSQQVLVTLHKFQTIFCTNSTRSGHFLPDDYSTAVKNIEAASMSSKMAGG